MRCVEWETAGDAERRRGGITKRKERKRSKKVVYKSVFLLLLLSLLNTLRMDKNSLFYDIGRNKIISKYVIVRLN